MTASQAIRPLATLWTLSAITLRLMVLLTEPKGWNRPLGSREPDQNLVEPGDRTENEPKAWPPKGVETTSPYKGALG